MRKIFIDSLWIQNAISRQKISRLFFRFRDFNLIGSICGLYLICPSQLSPSAQNPVAQYPFFLKIPSLKIHSFSKSRLSKSNRSQNPVAQNPFNLKIPSLKLHSISKSCRSKSRKSQNSVLQNAVLIFFCNLRHFFRLQLFNEFFAIFFSSY